MDRHGVTTSGLADPGAGLRTAEGGRPAAPDPRVLAQQLEMACRQAKRTPVPVLAACLAIGYIGWGYVDPLVLIGWGIATSGAISARALVSGRLIARGITTSDARVWGGRLTAFAFVNGLISGSIAPLLLPALPAGELALVTMVLCCWATAGIASNGAYPRAYEAFAAPFFAQIALGWFLSGFPIAWMVLALLVLFVLVLVAFVRDNGRTVAESIRLRYANEALLEQKEQLIELLRVAFEKAEGARAKAEEANRSKSQFLASASHDLRQPLHALSLLTALLNDMTEDAHVREVGRRIDRSVQSLDGLFNALLDLSKLDAGAVTPERQTFALSDLIERLSTEYQSKAHEKGLGFEVAADAVWVRTDPILLERMVRNLLENAIRFTPGGHVALRCARVPDGIEVSVSDTGPGIPSTEQTRIFEEFYQINNPSRDRSKGLGLGLSIVRRLADLLGYRVQLGSAVGRGSTFTLCLPASVLAKPPEPVPVPERGKRDDDVAGLVVLIIEDDDEVRSAIGFTLTRWGCHPLVVASLDEARALLAATGLRPAVLVCDLRLGNGASGIDAIARLRDEHGDIAAALVTGDTASERLAEVRASGLPVLHKPVPAAELRALLHELAREVPAS